MRKISFSLLLALASFCAAAQQQQLTIEDAVVKNRTTLAPENLKQLQFIYGTGDYVYAKTANGLDSWTRGSFSGEESEWLTLSQLNAILKENGLEELTAMPAINFSQGTDFTFVSKGAKIGFQPTTRRAWIITPAAIANKLPQQSSKAGFTAYVDNYNISVLINGTTKQITSDGNKDIVYGDAVHRNEFGITKGMFWSNDGLKLAFYRMDQSMVSDYPIIDWNSYPAKNQNIKYPMAGGKSHEVTLGVYDASNSRLVYLQTGEPKEQYLTNIAWSPDNQYIFIAVLNREQNHMKLNQYNATTGAFVKTVLEESDDKYTEPLVPVLFLKNNSSQFIWQSNRDGWNHLYLYDTTGKMIKQLTSGNWEVLDVKGFDQKGDNLFYSSTAESPITRNLYRLNVKSGKSTRVTDGFQVHVTQLSSDGNYVLDNASDPSHARVVSIVDTRSGKAKLLLQATDPLKSYALGRMTVSTISTPNGDLYYRLYRPVNFDSSKKYPVVVYWYGGPHVQVITDAYNGGAADYWFQYMAEHGFVVFSIDPRGSDNRGKAFEQSIFRRAGEMQMEDLMAGVDWLKKTGYADPERMALFGWSYGGFMTLDFILHHPGVFKVAVAGGPVTDWKYYEIMYGERYMDTPKENPEGYAATDLTKLAGELKGKLLVIHGLQDPVVVQQNSVNFVKAAIDKGVQVDYMIYPGHEHNVMGKDRAHLYQKITDYIFQNLDVKN